MQYIMKMEGKMREKVINPAQMIRRLDATRAELELDGAERKKTGFFGRAPWFRSDSHIRQLIPVRLDSYER